MAVNSSDSATLRRTVRQRINDRVQGFVFWVTLSTTAALMACYLWLGDRTWWSACIVVWPSFLWCLGLVPMTLFCLNIRRPQLTLILLAAVGLFQMTTVEWRSLIRRDYAEDRKRFNAMRSGAVSDSIAVRVAIWNVAGHMSKKSDVLAALCDLAPDICLLQETGSEARSFLSEDLVERWEGFHWTAAGDCGVLSRFPIRPVDDANDPGPGNRQFVEVELPGGARILAVNVHLMMPPIVRNITVGDAPVAYREGHAQRIAQYGSLILQIESHLAKLETEIVILAGDFNVGADARSLAPIRERLNEVWRTHGLGWGATVTASLPVARIDHCWVSENVEPVSARVVPTEVSDHRILLVDLIVPVAELQKALPVNDLKQPPP